MRKKTDLSNADISTKERVVEVFQLPKDIMLGSSIVTAIGNTEIWIENYKGILEYTSEKILLQGKKCQIGVYGKNLTIIYYTNDNMKITGNILSIKYN